MTPPPPSSDADEDDRAEPPTLLRVLKRWRAVIVLLPLLVGIGVAASIGASMLWADDADEAGPEPDVTCWDRSVAPASECSEPTGLVGLRWVYPGIPARAAGCTPEGRTGERGREDGQAGAGDTLAYVCPLPLGGDEVRLLYTRHATTEAGLERTARRHEGVEPEEDAGRLVYRGARPERGRWSLTAVYADHPFSVTVEAATARLRDLALSELVSRAPDDVTVRPAG
ncbi:hypothetical protein [Nocardioides dongxiaopingii]|uniref:hypothetical protein n=1 Tax=Nocardioides sp. S-1144 TaxID=2582905 RepID=UPI00110D7FA9|nr:hypothetical protein [Nocardioides sp. S-1144]